MLKATLSDYGYCCSLASLSRLHVSGYVWAYSQAHIISADAAARLLVNKNGFDTCATSRLTVFKNDAAFSSWQWLVKRQGVKDSFLS